VQRYIPLLLLLVCLIATASVPAPTIAQTYPNVTDPVTGFTYGGPIRRFWETSGGLAVFGHPLSELSTETVYDCSGNPHTLYLQYFERHRIELHNNASPYDVLLGSLGCKLMNKPFVKVQNPAPAINTGCRLFTETSLNMCGRFYQRWQQEGLNFGHPGKSYAEQLALFGLPKTVIRQETIESNPYQVQWTERARFEWNANGAYVSLGRLGAEMIDTGQANPLPVTALPISARSNYSGPPLDETQMAIYIFDPNDGPTLLVTPVQEQLNPFELEGQTLGLVVALKGIGPFEADTYSAVFRGDQLEFQGEYSGFSVPALVRSLRETVTFNQGLVSNNQICFLSGQASICGLLDLPINDQSRAIIKTATSNLEVSAQINEEQLITAIAGTDALTACARGLNGERTDYNACQPTVLAAPIFEGETLTPLDGLEEAEGIGTLIVGQDLREEVYAKEERRDPINILPAGEYRVYQLVISDDRELAPGVTMSWVVLEGRQGRFFLPAVVGVSGAGLPLQEDTNDGPRPTGAVTANIFLGDACFLRVAQCPYYQLGPQSR
jgi:hypothetical protein